MHPFSNTEFDESFRKNKPSTPFNREEDQFLLKYGHGNNRQRYPNHHFDILGSGTSSNKRYTTQFSQVSYPEGGFKKMKHNQLQAFKQLKQQYEILRDLPIQQSYSKETRFKKSSESVYSSQREETDNMSLSSKPQQHQKKKKKYHQQINARQNQMLALQKKQLEMVISNSMSKIEELLKNQVQYKKTIHELKLQLDSKGNDVNLQHTIKNLKRNEKQQNQIVSSLRKEVEKYRVGVKQLEEKNDRISGELTSAMYQFRSLQEQKRNQENLLRLEKDKRANLQIEHRKVTMEAEINEKDKNNEIKRLQKLLDSREPQKSREYSYIVKRMEEQIRTKDKRYEILLQQFEKYKREVVDKPPKQIVIEKTASNEEQLKIFQKLIFHMKDENNNQNRLLTDLLASVLNKVEETSKNKENYHQKEEDNALLNELYNLRKQLIDLKQNKKEEPQIIITRDNEEDYYKEKIKFYEEELEDLTSREKHLSAEVRTLESSLEQSKEEYEVLNENYLELKERMKKAEEENSHSSEKWRMKIREKDYEYEELVRQMRNQQDEADFTIKKIKKQEQFNLNLKLTECNENINQLFQENQHLKREKNELKAEIQKIKSFYESKIRQKNTLLDKASQAETVIREEHERALQIYKSTNEKQLHRLVSKIDGMAQINDKYVKLSQRSSQNEREVHQLKGLYKRFKFINERVDHLWSVKETEYGKINDLLKEIQIS